MSETTDARIAVIGYWCRVPGANSPSEFWSNLVGGVESVSAVPSRDGDARYVSRRGLVDGATEFAADFFGFTPAEAVVADPQHRLFLDCVWHALAVAGYDAYALDARVGVFGTQSVNEYRHAVEPIARSHPLRSLEADVGTSPAHMAAVTAYTFGFSGPVMAVQTACSSSLVAVHLARQALLTGECDVAVAGGASLGWPLAQGYVAVEGGIMSTTGHCRPFDANASGTVRGDGVGVVVLKRYQDAAAAGDPVRALLLGSAVNNDGRRRLGYSAPAIAGQREVIRAAVERACVAADSIGYVETHGTGTALGDAVEIAALKEALGSTQCRYLGAVKGNIGHLDATAGVVGFIKAAMTVESGVVAPIGNFERPHPELGLDAACDILCTRAEEWRAAEPRRAGVSSFGLGGTNAHAVLEQPPVAVSAPTRRGAQLLVLSADSRENLVAYAREVAEGLEFSGATLADCAYTLAVGRAPGSWRTAVVATDVAQARDRLADCRPIECSDRDNCELWLTDTTQADTRALEALCSAEATVRHWFQCCADKLFAATGLDVSDPHFPGQARLLAAYWTLAQVLGDWGIQPRRIVAEHVGEHAAAAISGRLTLEDVAVLSQATNAERARARVLLTVADIRESDPEVLLASTGTTMTARTLSDERFWQLTHEHGRSVALPRSGEKGAVHVATSLRSAEPATALLELVGGAWCAGSSVDWASFYRHERRSRVPMPVPALSRSRFEPPPNNDPSAAESLTAPAHLRTPATSTSELVLAAARETLGLADVALTDDFFDLGGCSLTAVELISRLSDDVGRYLELSLVFDNSRLGELAEAIGGASGRPEEPQRGFTTLQIESPGRSPLVPEVGSARKRPSFSLLFFSADAAGSETPYDFVFEAVSIAEASDFEAVWFPERHFHRFGGLFPSPPLLAAAAAATTRRIDIRAGSVILPLHHPAEVVEQWSVLDQLSRGRIGVSFAPGFHPTDFILRPEAFETRRDGFWQGVTDVRRMWRGEPFAALDGLGRPVDVTTFPRPRRRDLPVWITASERADTFARAGETDANVLSAMLALDMDELAAHIAVYRDTRVRLGLSRGHVTVMLHTFVHDDPTMVQAVGASALRSYLDMHMDFAAPRAEYTKVGQLLETDRNALLAHAVRRYLDRRSLIGTPQVCAQTVRALADIGVDEIACLVDFGVPEAFALDSLRRVATLAGSDVKPEQAPGSRELLNRADDLRAFQCPASALVHVALG